MNRKRIVVTGGAGYIGSVLTELLLDNGYDVTILDRFFFGDTLGHLRARSGLSTIEGDIRTFDGSILDGAFAVLDLAALSNDPSGELHPERTMDINYRGRVRVAKLARQFGVRHYILASSCSVYGFQDRILDEQSAPNPLTAYARASLAAEQDILPLGTRDFAVTVVRQATVYGLSPRMRFDLAINGMSLGLATSGKMAVLRPGSQWRPMVHVRDTSRAFLAIVEAGAEAVSGETFNVGSDDQNFQVLPLAESLASAVGVPFEPAWYGEPDHRSYRVSFRKLSGALNYSARFGPADAAREIVGALTSGQVEPGLRTKTVEWYKQLLQQDSRVLDPLAPSAAPTGGR